MIPQDYPRVIIEAIQPQIDCGRFPIKRVMGETVTVTADIYKDASGRLDCTGCHPDAELTSNCTTSTCHNEGSATYRAKHHNYIPNGTSTKPACTSCHTQLKPTTGSCQDCHAPESKRLQHHYAKDSLDSDKDGNPIEHLRANYRGDRFKFQLDI